MKVDAVFTCFPNFKRTKDYTLFFSLKIMGKKMLYAFGHKTYSVWWSGYNIKRINLLCYFLQEQRLEQV